MDGGSWQDPEQWSRRCAKCRAKWNDHERWKASVNQFDIWTRVLKRRCPDLLVGSCIYPYTFNALTAPAKDRSPKWAESMPEYWQKLDRNLESKEFFFSATLRETRDVDRNRSARRHFSAPLGVSISAYGQRHRLEHRAKTYSAQGIDTRRGGSQWRSSGMHLNKDAPVPSL